MVKWGVRTNVAHIQLLLNKSSKSLIFAVVRAQSLRTEVCVLCYYHNY